MVLHDCPVRWPALTSGVYPLVMLSLMIYSGHIKCSFGRRIDIPLLCDVLFNSRAGCPPPVFITEDRLCYDNITMKSNVQINTKKDLKLSACLKWSRVLFTSYKGHKCIEDLGQLSTEPPCDRDLDSVQINNPSISLHRACEDGDLCKVQLILSHNLTDINCRGKLNRTPVMAATVKGRIAVIDFLVNQGCDLKAVDSNKQTVLEIACESGDMELARHLFGKPVEDKMVKLICSAFAIHNKIMNYTYRLAQNDMN